MNGIAVCLNLFIYTHTQIWDQDTYDSIKGQNPVHKKMFLVALHLNNSYFWLERYNPKIQVRLNKLECREKVHLFQ